MNEYMYDACIKLALDPDEKDKIHKPLHPVNMYFGDGTKGAKHYINYLLRDPKKARLYSPKAWTQRAITRVFK